MAIVQQERTVPKAIGSRSGMVHPDYVDVFTVETGRAADRSPEQWARAGVEDAAGLGGQFVWRALLGLRLKRRPSPDHIGGWKVADRGHSWIRLEASSWFMTAHLVMHVEERHASVGTFIRYDRPIASLVWSWVSAGHRRAMPRLLRRAVKRLSEST